MDAFRCNVGNDSRRGVGAIEQLADMNGSDNYACEYNMRNKRRGLAIIFNHEHFDSPEQKSRSGTNVDCKKLVGCLKQLNFEVIVHKDFRLNQLMIYIQWAADQNHSDADCILVAILSHGEHGVIHAKDLPYKLHTVLSCFTAQHCPTLAGKPKIFFIQACQGNLIDPGVSMKIAKTKKEKKRLSSYQQAVCMAVPSPISTGLPAYPDFLIAYSSIPGFFSWRNNQNGSWFIQSLCDELSANGKHLDILTLLTFVCQRVAVNFESNRPDEPHLHERKQVPCITTMLRYILRFRDKTTSSAGLN